MTESNYWRFARFGPAADVMERARTGLAEPGPGQALVEILSVGLNQAENRYLLGTHFPPKTLPACIGHEAVGRIVALGPESEELPLTRRWKAGDRVALVPMLVDIAGMGALRDYGLYDCAALLPVPESFSDREGAAFWMGVFTMAGAMDMAGLGSGTCVGRGVVVTAAAGGMGCLGLKLVRALGGSALALTRSASKAEALTRLADRAAVVRAPEELAAVVRDWRADGADAVIDPLGGGYLTAAVEALAPGGRYVCYEWVAGRAAAFDIAQLIERSVTIGGFTIFHLLRHPGLLDRLVRIGMHHAEALRPVLAADYDFSAAPEAFSALARGGHVGKITVSRTGAGG